MSAPIVTSNRRSLPSPRFQREAAGRMPSAQHILWREWRNCDDADYARYLFGLLVDQPLDELALVVSGLIGAIVGAVGGLLVAFLLTGLFLTTNSSDAALWGWLLGPLAGGVLGSCSLMWWFRDRSLISESAYAYRRACLWWAGRPPAAQVEVALGAQAGQDGLLQQLREQVVSSATARSAVSQKAVLPGQVRRRGWWPAVVRYLAFLVGGASASVEEAQAAGGSRKPAKTVEDLLKDLQAPTWQERFMARHALVALGGEVVPKLLDFTDASKSFDLGDWFIRSIAYETGRRLAAERQMWICPACLTTCGGHIAIDSYGLPVTFYGCRTCGQSRHLLYCPQGVVAVLDAKWAEAYSYQNNRLWANWLVCRTLFDFDAVEIVHASDEDVERLAMNAGNDTDPVRRARYPHVRCAVAPECRLSENSLRVLEQVFGQVESRATLQNAF
jgi:hypothetical protein